MHAMCRKLAGTVYRSTAAFPADERYGLTAQMRRAAISVGSNVAEGSALSDAAFARHLTIALGSIAELEFQSVVAADLGYLSDPQLSDIERELSMTGRAIRRLRSAVEPT